MNTIKALLTLLVLGVATPSLAQQGFPNHPVRLVLGVSPGGVQDLLARRVAQDLAKVWGQAVVVENHPGATGIIAATQVAKSTPDGYTILLSTANNMESAPVLQKNLPFDPIKDFTPVISLATTKNVVLINSKVPAANLKEFVALAHSKPGVLTYGSWGVGSVAHLDAAAFAKTIKADFLHVPYKGGNEVMVALASGQVDLALTTVSTSLSLVKQGSIRALAYTGDHRSSLLPDVPTLTELGYTFNRPGGVFSFYMPSATPKALVDKIAKDTREVLSTAAFKKDFLDINAMEPYSYDGAALVQKLADSRKDYLARLKDLNINAD